jgi:class 3 adenylate cyclase
VTIRRKNLGEADDQRRFPHGIGVSIDLGTLVIGRAVLEPGWRWSLDIRPSVGTASCQIHHLHLLLEGRFAVEMDDGEMATFGPNDVMDIPPGHDAWVIGSERVVLIDIAGNAGDFGLPVSRSRMVASILMSDIVASTELAGRVGDAEWKQRLAEHNRVVRRQLERFGGREIDTTGDGFLAVFDAAGAALLAALAMRDAVRAIELSLRVGVHTGEVEMVGTDVAGLAVHAAARVMAAASPDEILTTTVTRIIAEGAHVRFEDRGEQQLKGLVQPLHLYAVEHGD